MEFEILFTCFDLAFNSRLKELYAYNFTKKDVNNLRLVLVSFTNDIIKNFPKLLDESKISLEKMTKRRIELEYKLNKKREYQNLLETAENLLRDCRKFGTLPFSTMARIGFISSIILKSAVKEKYLEFKEIENFMNSIKTPLTELQEDLFFYSEGKLSKKQFLEKYGHLRPGTYDITAMCYEKDNPIFEIMKFSKNMKNVSYEIDNSKLLKIFSKSGLKFQNISFSNFVRESLVLREVLKFEFTKNLSEALELIAEAGKKLGFSRQDVSNLKIELILK